MKLKKILLPIASVASVATIVAPIVTSCGKQKGDFYQDISQYTSGEKVFERTTDKKTVASEEPWTNTQATAEYLKDIKNNKQIFYDDVFEDLFGVNPTPSTNKETEYSGTFGLTFNNVNVDKKELSVGIFANLEAKQEITDPKTNATTEMKLVIKGDIQLVDIPVELSYGSYSMTAGTGWSMTINTLLLGLDWSIKGNGFAKFSMGDIDAHINLDCDYSNDSSASELVVFENIINQLLGEASLRIPYLENVPGIVPTPDPSK